MKELATRLVLLGPGMAEMLLTLEMVIFSRRGEGTGGRNVGREPMMVTGRKRIHNAARKSMSPRSHSVHM